MSSHQTTEDIKTITRKEIGEILKAKYPSAGDELIEYFYFEVQVSPTPDNMKAIQGKVCETLNKDCKGDLEWRLVGEMTVTSKEKSSFRFFGNITVEVEFNARQKEKKLDSTRLKLEEELKSEGAKILITRACKYNAFDF